MTDKFLKQKIVDIIDLDMLRNLNDHLKINEQEPGPWTLYENIVPAGRQSRAQNTDKVLPDDQKYDELTQENLLDVHDIRL